MQFAETGDLEIGYHPVNKIVFWKKIRALDYNIPAYRKRNDIIMIGKIKMSFSEKLEEVRTNFESGGFKCWKNLTDKFFFLGVR